MASRLGAAPTLGEDRLLAAQLLEHLGSTGEAITTLANRNVEDELLDLELTHHILVLRTEGGRSVRRLTGLSNCMLLRRRAARSARLRALRAEFRAAGRRLESGRACASQARAQAPSAPRP